jgi:Methyltransferase domain
MDNKNSIFLRAADLLLNPVVMVSAILLRIVRGIGIDRLPICKKALQRIGIYPIRDRYYEPRFNYAEIRQPFSQDRFLPGIDWNIQGQLELLSAFSYAHELVDTPMELQRTAGFYVNNHPFGPGDAEYWYQLIRFIKPRRIFEIGSGQSTLMAMKAIRKNQEENPDCISKHVCVEPYEAPWLEETGVTVIRKKVEDLEVRMFAELGQGDILFIDSSHIVRPQGDVLFEYLELLPALNIGVIVHVHDIFSPKDYPAQWLVDRVKFWNEQYLLEAFLSHNKSWKILGGLNYLHYNHYEKLKAVAPFLTPDRDPGSFYMERIA